jgi:DNA replication ATP-dependent helicase Dna2
MEIDDRAIGIITPYRAQIATIKSEFETVCPHLLDKITIDTVERYQGGARDIIILSLCTNRMSQLRSLVSLSKEGVDRKLNVAVTRAREQLIVIGNREILEGNETYQSLINSAFEWNV